MQTLQELLVEEIQDLYDAEKQLVKALPRFAKSASHPELSKAFQQHLKVTEGQVKRIEQVFQRLGEKPRSRPCKAMKGLIEEGREVLAEKGEHCVHDSAMIVAAQKVEHYEISGYGSARALAEALGLRDAARLLKQTEDEESKTDELLTKIAGRIYTEHGKEDGGPNGRSKMAAKESRPVKNGGSSSQRGVSSKKGGTTSSAETKVTTDHEEIRRWAEERGAKPARVKGTGGKGDPGVLRLDFPGYTGEDTLEHISWEEFFDKFDKNKLAFIYQEKTADGAKSNFNKIVSRETVESELKRTSRK
jgi:ferritin-like metal-binding protein YciE